MSFVKTRGGYIWSGITRAVEILLYLNLGLFLLMLLVDGQTDGQGRQLGWMTAHLALWPEAVRAGAVWQLFTYMFLHSGYLLWHIIMNMLGLVLIGPETERTMGTRHFVIMYLVAGLLGGVAQVFGGQVGMPTVGASGALMGVLGAFVALHPQARVVIVILPFWPIRAWIIGVVFLLFQIVPIALHHQSNVAYWVHLGGGLAGFAYTVAAMRPHWLRGRRPAPRGPSSPLPEFDLAEADRILEKLHHEGKDALTAEEWGILEEAQRRFMPRKPGGPPTG